jgi:hypothetical protein
LEHFAFFTYVFAGPVFSKKKQSCVKNGKERVKESETVQISMDEFFKAKNHTNCNQQILGHFSSNKK